MGLDKFLVASADVQQPANSGEVFFIAGTIRNTGSGFFWINNSAHTPVNVNTGLITTTSTEVEINFIQPATKVISLVVVPDETYAVQGIFCGASVDLDKARISFANALGLVDPTTLTSGLGNFWVFGIMLK